MTIYIMRDKNIAQNIICMFIKNISKNHLLRLSKSTNNYQINTIVKGNK